MVNAPTGYGDLPNLARLALQPNPDRVASSLELRQAQTAHLKSRTKQSRNETQRKSEQRHTFRPDIRQGDPPPVSENPRYAEADVLRLQSRLKSSEERLEVVESDESSFRLPMSRREDQSALSAAELKKLRSLQPEIRSLRKDISNISSALARVGVRPDLTVPDGRSTETTLAERRGFSTEANQALNTQIRRQQSAKINDRQRMLLTALRRVERKLAGMPVKAQPPAEHGKVIGDIYKVRFSIASFPGPSVASMLGGMLFDTAV